MKNKSTLQLLILSVTIILLSMTTASASAAKGLVIEGQKISFGLNHYQYYRVVRNTKVSSWHFSSKAKCTLPKGTIVAGQKFNGSAVEKRHILIDLLQLDYHLLMKGRPANEDLREVADSTASLQPQNFKRISRPAYMPVYSSGRLFQMDFFPNDDYPRKAVHSLLKITANGVVEFTRWSASDQANVQQRPQHRAKIQKATNQGNTRHLYLSKKIPGLKLKSVGKTGKQQYRLSIVNQHKPFIFSGKTDDDMPIEYYSRYTVGDQTFSTLIGSVHD